MPDGATGALPNAPDMKIGASSCEIETPKLPKPPLYPRACMDIVRERENVRDDTETKTDRVCEEELSSYHAL